MEKGTLQGAVEPGYIKDDNTFNKLEDTKLWTLLDNIVEDKSANIWLLWHQQKYVLKTIHVDVHLWCPDRYVNVYYQVPSPFKEE